MPSGNYFFLPVNNETMKRYFLYFLAMLFLGLPSLQAEEEQPRIEVGADFVSTYVWRGMYQSGVSIQPVLALNLQGFRLEAWGSTDFGDSKEIDLTASYTFGESGLSLQVSDMWWPGQGTGRYFQYGAGKTDHNIEAGVLYELPCEALPLAFSWYTFFYGADRDESGQQEYSSYLEISYPFTVKQVDLELAVGAVPFRSTLYETRGFSVTNLSLTASKSLPITDHFSLPLFVQASWNPRLEDAHLVAGFTLSVF